EELRRDRRRARLLECRLRRRREGDAVRVVAREDRDLVIVLGRVRREGADLSGVGKVRAKRVRVHVLGELRPGGDHPRRHLRIGDEPRGPNNAETGSFWTSSRTAVVVLAGSPSSSRTTNDTCRPPSRPPEPLM